MSQANQVRTAVSTIKGYCDNMKCRRGEKCLFYKGNNHVGECRLACQPTYWQTSAVKTRKEVFLERFPNARRDPLGEPHTCVKNVFGTIEGDCVNKTIHCDECWDKPAPDEYQEDLE